MMNRRQFGDCEICQIFEFVAPTVGSRIMLPELPEGAFEAHTAFMANRFWMPKNDQLVIAIKLNVLFVRGEVVIIDTGEGNFKSRPASWANNLNNPVVEWLASLGLEPADVRHVVNTHLHHDHVGWNTVQNSERWDPCFPNANYYLPRVDFDHSLSRFEAGEIDVNQNSFGDSVLPIASSGRMTLMDPGDTIAGCLKVLPAMGHSRGQVALSAQGGGVELIFCGDVFHSPIQVFYPHVNSKWCEVPDQAKKTRLWLLNHAADTGALLFPAHSGVSDGWCIERQETDFNVSLVASRS